MKNVNKIKVGDKVVLTANSWESVTGVGGVGFVTETNMVFCRVSVTNNPNELGNNSGYEEVKLVERPKKLVDKPKKLRNTITLEDIQDKNVGGRTYNTAFRHAVCTVAVHLDSATEASNHFNVGRSTVWRWMKTYGYSTQYFANRYQTVCYKTPFDNRISSRYDDETRLAAVIFGLRQGKYAAADYFDVSTGSIYNWTKSFGLGRLQNN
jgi:transposase-like protein